MRERWLDSGERGGGEWRERDAALAIYFVIFLSVFPSFFLAACLDWLNYGLSKLRRKKTKQEKKKKQEKKQQ